MFVLLFVVRHIQDADTNIMKRELTDSFIKKAATPKPDNSPANYSDGGGLYLHVNRVGKYWRYNFRFQGVMKTLSIGRYPEITLKLARERHEEARALLARGIDPCAFKKQAKKSQADQVANSFENVAREWFIKHLSTKSESHRKRTISYLKRDVFPYLGKRPIHEIRPMEITPIIERIQRRVEHDAHMRVLQSIGQVFRYAIANELAEHEPTASLKGLFSRNGELVHFPAITEPHEVGRLMRAIDHYSGSFVTQCALKLSALVMLRPSELIGGLWSEIDLASGLWTIEVRRMKADTKIKQANQHKHVIPLPRQAIDIFEELKPLTGHQPHIFPAAGRMGNHRSMSKETVSKALHRMGFKGQMTAHGFRSMASTMLNEMSRWNPDAIERQLAHKEKNRVRDAYNRAQYLDERREMLQAWADYLDALKTGGQVIPFKAKA
ncbi:tyrosine-type recombinase/integrase [Thiolinea disciformis]|uniref:tyrosine-type recombinase/integrase n=1 Tax=Thiolinea disciformis TaxID=125614 RepID=UPI0003A9701A|nr:integrase arm-type DNA-binding domain-containing protein [Thiolinea disciformis]